MTTKLVTVEPDDTLSHAAQLLRQHHFHHLPVVRSVKVAASQGKIYTSSTQRVLLFEGVLTAQDIEMAAAFASQASASGVPQKPWQEQRAVEVMRPAPICVTPQTFVGSAAQLLVERGLQYLPVVVYAQPGAETYTILVGLLTRSDLLIALARAMGTFEPGMHLEIELPLGDMMPLAETLRIAHDHHIQIRSVIATPLVNGAPRAATLLLGTINPAPLFVHLREAGIQYTFANPLTEEGIHA